MIKKIFLSLASTLFLSHIATAAVVEDHSHLKVFTPSLRERTIRKLRLDNQLEVLLVSDPESPYAAAALSVGVGSSHDPISRAGLAHYTEHMLFLGNKKYPEEEGFGHFLDSHGGKRNAFTMADRTVYMFSIANEGFEEGLDRFAHFFISPNFTSSGLQRECKAIHQEYCKNLPNDDWRMLYVKKSLCNEAHPFHGFCIGNLETLSNVSHEEIKSWYDANYSANVMRLCVYSNQSLDELEKIVTPLFQTIENKKIERVAPAIAMLPQTKEKQLCFVAPVQDRCCLEISWELPRHFADDKERHIDKLVGHILGHEGDHTLLSKLKEAGLAHKLACGTQKTGTGEGLFLLSIELTNQGADQYERVITHCFETIQAMKKEGLPRYLFDEVQKTEEINYCYQTRGDLFKYVMEQAMHMQDEPIETFPRKSLIPTKYDAQAFVELLNLLTPQTAHYMVLAHPELTRVFPDKKERWMQVAYGEKTIREGLLNKWATSESKTVSALPPPNLFLPETLQPVETTFCKGASFDLIASEKSPLGMLYVAKDHCFLTPKANWQIHYKTSLVSPKISKSGALMDLFAMAFQDIVNEKYYAAKLAHLDFQLKPKEDGFALTIAGFEDKLPLFISSLCKEMKQMSISPLKLATYKEMLLKEYESHLMQSPLSGAHEMVSSILYENYQTLEQKAEELIAVTLEECNAFATHLFDEGYLEASCYGSREAEEAIATFTLMQKTLGYAPFAEENHAKRKLARFAKIGQPTYLEERFPLAAGGLMVTMDFGDFSFESRAVQEILSKAIEEPFFSELRTRQQTAYVVTNWSQELERHLYNFFAIQSSSHDPRDLLARFELFLESFLMNLEEHHLPQARFELIKHSLVTQLTQPQFDLPMMGHLFHTLAFEYKGDFDWLTKRAAAVETLSYQSFLQQVAKLMKENRQERIAVLMRGTFEEQAPFAYELSQSIHSLKERLDYK